MSKRLISVMLALVMVLSVFSVSAFAAVNVEYETFDEEAGETEVAYTQAWSLVTTNEADANGKYTVDVCLETNYAVGAISFSVVAEGATLEGVTVSDEILDVDGYNGDVQVNLGKGNVYIVPQPTDKAAEGLNLETSTVIATLTYSLNDGVDSATVTLNNDAKTIDNAGKLIAVRLSDVVLASETMYYGQRVIDANGDDVELGTEISSVTLGEEVAAEPADLAKKATAEAGILIDTAHTFGGAYKGVVFGFTQAANNTFMNTNYLNNAFEATNEGTLTYSRSIGTSGYGTGTVITVLNSDGTESCKYVVVIFGDVDGNGLINTTDTGRVKAGAGNAATYANNSVQRMAANCQNVAAAAMMHTLNTNDTAAVKKHVGGVKLDQAALASRMASNPTYYK